MTNEEMQKLNQLREQAAEFERLKRQQASEEAHELQLAQMREEQAEEQRKQQAAAANAERDRINTNFQRMVVPETYEVYKNLPASAKVELIKAFGETFPSVLMRKERSGLDWTQWRRAQYAKAIPGPAPDVEHLPAGAMVRVIDGIRYLITADGRRKQVQ